MFEASPGAVPKFASIRSSSLPVVRSAARHHCDDGYEYIRERINERKPKSCVKVFF